MTMTTVRSALAGAVAALIIPSAASAQDPPAAPPPFGRYAPGGGFKLVDTEQGDLNFRLFTYVRYLNQLGLDETYTDAFGTTREI